MLSTFMKELVDDTSGATAIEYGLIVALIVIAMISALGAVADSTIAMWGRVESESTTAMTTP
jgi:pilus assembly protein Flp/PilA